MVMDLKKFQRTAARKKNILGEFLDKFDHVVPPGMTKIVAAADTEVWEEVKCMECANCCKTMTPIYTPADVKRIAGHLEMSLVEFRENYLVKEEDSGNWINKTMPCTFLKHDKCSIYEVRPADCAGFPHHSKKPFDAYNETFKNNLVHCPATLLLVDKLKKKIGAEFEF